jgi:hypothetical protein
MRGQEGNIGTSRGDTNHRVGEASSTAPTNTIARIPKDITRMTFRLLAFTRRQGVLMLEQKTHYEQVLLEIVRKIVEEQILQEVTTEQAQETNTLKLEEDLVEAQEGLIAGSGPFSNLER